MVRVAVRPGLITWAIERAGISPGSLERRFQKLPEWRSGELSPTLKQLQDFANVTHAPLGYFFLSAPPEEDVPLPDFRTIRDEEIRHPSPDLLDTVFQCQQRQDWYREYAISIQDEPVRFVGSLDVRSDVVQSAETIRDVLKYDLSARSSRWADTFRILRENAESVGILVMVNGVVGNNTHRKLNSEEFRGFALTDPYAPLVFVNGADTVAAQLFTLAHEIAHIWLGRSGLDDLDATTEVSSDVERWCNAVAAELLVPTALLLDEYRGLGADPAPELDRLAARFRTSTLVILRKIFDATGSIERERYYELYRAERRRVLDLLAERDGSGGGGNFYNTSPVRSSRRFATAVVTSALEGRTLYRDAFNLLGVRKTETFHKLAEHLEVA